MILQTTIALTALPDFRKEISQYGITWEFDKPMQTGQSVTGDWWVVGPVSIVKITPEQGPVSADKSIIQEDTQTYYGTGWFGQKVLWQMIMHHGKRDAYEEKPPEQWEKWDNTSESYRVCCNAVAWTGTALAARYMKAIKLWGHDAHFDYVERWMRIDDPYREARGKHPLPGGETDTFDPFVTEMWKAHRNDAPEQEMSGIYRKWVWQGNNGGWISNPH